MSISQEIDARIGIVELVGRYVHLKKAGTNFKALCPFHNEKTASFIISPAKNIAYCFSCHNGGGPVKFLSEIEKIPFGEAVQKLAREAGIELKTDYYKERKENKRDIYDIYKLASSWYHENLLKEENRSKMEYLLNRGLTPETIRKFGIGFSSDPRGLFYKLKESGFQEKDIVESGVFVSPFKDKFFGRITFPIHDYTGNIVAFTGRVLDASLPKYLNSPSSKIFDKSSILYGLHFAKQDISKRGYVVIVEGQMDVLALHQAGFTNTVAISGTALTQEQIKLLKRLTRVIYLCLDKDNAGIQATFQSLENTINEDIDVRIIDFKDAKDPDEYLKSGGDWNDPIRDAMSPVAFYISQGNRKYDLSTIQGKKDLIKEICRFLKTMNSKIEIDLHLKELSNLLGVSMNILYEELRNTRSSSPRKEEPENAVKQRSFDIYEELSAYIENYQLFDLFLKNFHYNMEDMEGPPSLNYLKKVILRKEGLFEDSGVDHDRVKAIELFIEEENQGLNEEKIKRKFLDMILALQKKLFEDEKKTLETVMRNDPNDTETLMRYAELIRKGKNLGVLK